MKKQNNILAYIKLAFGFVFISALFFACQDDEIIKSNEVEEGLPVEVKFNMSIPEMATLTRGLRDEEEFQMNDLYLLIFDSKGNRKEGTKYYSSEELISHTDGNQSNPTNGSLKVNTTSGKSYIFAAANVNSNQLSGGENIKKQLDGVQSIQDLKKVTAILNSQTNAAQVDRTQAALVMCGAYVSNKESENTEEGVCTIPTTNSTLNGKIILERLDSHITFNISWGGNKSKVTSFELTGWRVYNVPVKSYLLSQVQDAVGDNENDYAISPSEHKVTSSETSCSFDFYMLENRKQKQKYDGRFLQSYAEREAEVKRNDKNTGIYKYVEPYATYVEIKANMELSSSQTVDGKKVATVTYVIHLGGGYDDFTNFESKRNKKYTYNVEINDTEDIRVEVQEDKERRPGVEGDVIDAKTKVYTLDSHYSCFILALTKKEARELSFMVKTPFGTVDNNTDINQRANGDYKWIRFKYNDSYKASSTLEKYPANGSGLIDLYGLSADVLNRTKYSSETKKIYYTVFIDEYYYNTPPAGQNWSTPYWKHFVNKENRYAILLFSPQYSKDGDSSYADAQYLITQRSIQTYYSTEHFNDDKTALGMEHVNETGEPSSNNPGISNLSNSNGYYNNYRYINRDGYRSWSSHASLTSPNTEGYTFRITKDNAWSDCLSRNRDENNNGTIDPEELKWYLPTRDQLLGMCLGAESLTTPLFDADSYPRGTIALEGDTRFHYLMSNNQKIWGEEGGSIGEKGYAGQPKEIRCVRNLNLEMNSSNASTESKKVGNVFTYNSTNHVFNLEQMDGKNIRGKVTAELGIHDNFSISNRPYKAFQMAKNFHTSEEGYGPWAQFVDIDRYHNSLCQNYSEKTSDKGKWRTPNQREFMIMYAQNIDFVRYTNKNKETDYRGYTRTEWKYKADRHFGYNDGILFLDQPTSYNISLRCVRDVDIDANGNIINDN